MINSKGEVKMGLLEILLSMLPENDITIPDSVAISYAGLQGGQPEIRDGRMYGYFEGVIDGMGDDAITDPLFNKNGDLQLDENTPFQLEVSSQLINNALEVILGHHYISVDVTYDTMQQNGFPIDWTTTQLEGAIPGIGAAYGYDVPLSCKFQNEGAPKFIFTGDEMEINYDMTVQVWNKNYVDHLMDIHFHGLVIKFKMQLLSNMTLMVDWESIHMSGAHVEDFIGIKQS